MTTEETHIDRTSTPRRAIANAIGIDLLHFVVLTMITAGVLALLLLSPLGQITAVGFWLYEGSGVDWVIWPYHITQLSIIFPAAFMFVRSRGTKGMRYLERSQEIPLESRFKQNYRLSLGVAVVVVLLLVTELVFCGAFDACLTIVFQQS